MLSVAFILLVKTMPQETKSHPLNPDALDHSPGFTHQNLEGFIPPLATEDEIRSALEQAFDYRGDITLTLKDANKIEGYIFDRRHRQDPGRLPRPPLPQRPQRKNLCPYDQIADLNSPAGHRRRQKLRNLGQKIPAEKSRRRKKHRASNPKNSTDQ